SNIDKAFLLVTLNNPKTSYGFIDRFLVTCEAYHIPAVLLFNKMDAYDLEQLKSAEEYKSVYRKIGYETLEISAKSGLNLEELKNDLKRNTSLVSGHSGVAKST